MASNQQDASEHQQDVCENRDDDVMKFALTRTSFAQDDETEIVRWDCAFGSRMAFT